MLEKFEDSQFARIPGIYIRHLHRNICFEPYFYIVNSGKWNKTWIHCCSFFAIYEYVILNIRLVNYFITNLIIFTLRSLVLYTSIQDLAPSMCRNIGAYNKHM